MVTHLLADAVKPTTIDQRGTDAILCCSDLLRYGDNLFGANRRNDDDPIGITDQPVTRFDSNPGELNGFAIGLGRNAVFPGSHRARAAEDGIAEFEAGFMYRRLHDGDTYESDSWLNGRLSMMPNLFAPVHFEWRVPVDDRTTLSVIWFPERVVESREPYVQAMIPHWWGRATDADGRPITSHVLGQDVMSWTGQGVIADRTKEHLGRSDRGVQMFRRRLEADLAAIERGDDPSGLVRDPARNQCIRFPNEMRRNFLSAPSPELIRRKLAVFKSVMPGSRPEDHFFLLEGQPDHIREEWEWCLGLRDDRPDTTEDLSANGR